MASTTILSKKVLNLKGCTIQSSQFLTVEKQWNKGIFLQEHLLLHVRPTKYEELRCPICGRKCSYYDHKYDKESSWRASNLNGVPVYLLYQTRRINCPEHGVLTERIPWADGNSRFTPDFNNEVAWMVRRSSKTTVALLYGIHWETIGNCVKAAHKRLEPDVSIRLHGLRRICIDETSYRKGHSYITVVYDMDRNQVVWVHPNHGKEVLEQFCELLSPEEREQIEIVAGDGARWITECTEKYFPNAKRCLDFFHAVEWANEALDQVRISTVSKATRIYNTEKEKIKREEETAYLAEQKLIRALDDARSEYASMPLRGRPSARKLELQLFIESAEASLAELNCAKCPKGIGRPKKEQFSPDHQAKLDDLQAAVKQLKGSKLALGHDPNKCTSRQKEIISLIQMNNPELFKGYQLKETFRLITHMKDVEAAKIALDNWIKEANESGIKPFEELSAKILRHRENIINAISTGCNSAKSEATNTTIKVMIHMARGFRNLENLEALVYLKCSTIVIPLNNRPQNTPEQDAAIRKRASEQKKNRREMLQTQIFA